MARMTADEVIAFIRKRGVVRPRDLEHAGISRMWLARLLDQGVVTRVGRGLYLSADFDLTEHHSFAEVSARVPHAVVCLLSALSFHDLTTQLPFEVWIAIDRKARVPKDPGVALRVMRFSGLALTAGVEDHVIDGVRVSVFNPAKTVVDCFRYRNKVGLDVALEALRDCYRQRKATINELWDYAEALHMRQVMRPYLESLQ